jgi:hypothetical protein
MLEDEHTFSRVTKKMLKSKKTPEEYWRQINNQYDSNGELINKIPELVLQTRQGNVKKVAENE